MHTPNVQRRWAMFDFISLNFKNLQNQNVVRSVISGYKGWLKMLGLQL